tara:strand:- start:124 stop:2310 length:2187 start_codon:yes stop_codon:yes gene_type:complete
MPLHGTQTTSTFNPEKPLGTQLQDMFSDILSLYPELKTSVQGFTEYDAGAFKCSAPQNVQNLLGPQFTRNFALLLQSELEHIKQEPQIKKEAYHKTLLHKYLGVTDLAHPQVSDIPPAMGFVCEDNAPDQALHTYFLRPFLLFGITPKNRKHTETQSETNAFDWLWGTDKNTNSAHFFRSIIQLYILEEILSEYKTETKGNWESPDIRASRRPLQDLKSALFKTIQNHFISLLYHVHLNGNNPSQKHMSGSPNGLMSRSNHNLLRILDDLLPGLSNVTSQYAIGRLLFGQPQTETRHEQSIQNIDRNQSALIFWFKYISKYILTHLNLASSILWIRCSIALARSQWKTWVNFIRHSDSSFVDLAGKCLFFIPNLIIILATPILTMMPWVYGLSSIPFSLLRYFIMHGPTARLKHFWILHALDTLEFIKDFIIFVAVAAPLLESIFSSIVAFLPSSLLSIGAISAFIPTFIFLCVILSKNYTVNIWDSSSSFAYSAFGMAFGTTLFLASTLYLGGALLGQKLYPLIPDSIAKIFNSLVSPLVWVGEKLANFVDKLFGFKPNNNLADISIPETWKQAPVSIETLTDSSLPAELKAQAAELHRKLGRLNQAFNFSVDRKKFIRNTLDELDNSATPTDLTEAIEKAELLLSFNFTNEQATKIQSLITSLDSNEQFNLNKENVSIRVSGSTSGYQPSWGCIQKLRETHQFEQLPTDIQDKCVAIENLKINATV